MQLALVGKQTPGNSLTYLKAHFESAVFEVMVTCATWLILASAYNKKCDIGVLLIKGCTHLSSESVSADRG